MLPIVFTATITHWTTCYRDRYTINKYQALCLLETPCCLLYLINHGPGSSSDAPCYVIYQKHSTKLYGHLALHSSSASLPPASCCIYVHDGNHSKEGHFCIVILSYLHKLYYVVQNVFYSLTGKHAKYTTKSTTLS